MEYSGDLGPVSHLHQKEKKQKPLRNAAAFLSHDQVSWSSSKKEISRPHLDIRDLRGVTKCRLVRTSF